LPDAGATAAAMRSDNPQGVTAAAGGSTEITRLRSIVPQRKP